MIELSTLITPIFSALLGAGSAAIGVYVAMSNRLSVLETKMDNLAASVEKHNGVIERTFKAESEINNLYHRIDDVKDEIHHYHS